MRTCRIEKRETVTGNVRGREWREATKNKINVLTENTFSKVVSQLTSSSEPLYDEDGMNENLETVWEELTQEIGVFSQPDFTPLRADHWIVSSILQKSIRRSDAVLAERAALSFLKVRGNALWRRFLTIAFEDVGAASAASVIRTVIACDSPQWRKNVGGDFKVAAFLARILAQAPKDRTSDYLICAAQRHPSLDTMREFSGTLSSEQRPYLVMEEESFSLPQRAVLAWHASGIGWVGAETGKDSTMTALLDAFCRMRVPKTLAHVSCFAAERAKLPICIMVPLIWGAIFKKEQPTVEDMPVPASPVVGDIPLYALDKHTRLGKQAIRRFARENDAVRSLLEEFVPEYRQQEAACVSVFYGDAMPIAHRLIWSQTHEMETLGLESDLLRDGVPMEGIVPLIKAVRENLDHLNDIRARIFTQSSSPERGHMPQSDLFKEKLQ